jgi:hypothetical protein
MQDIRKTQLLLIGITVAVLAPFLNKAFHIDDPLFLWMAQQIAKHPLDPYGFSVNWATSPEPMWKVMQNPPLCSYYIAAVASLVGWSEPALHFAFLLWPIMSILATFAIARRFCREPFTAALLTLFTPAFLISATNVMCDVMLLALWLWSIELWLAGLERNRWWLFALSAFLAAAAALTKYFGISLVPLLGVYTLVRDRRRWGYLFFLLVPIAAVIVFEAWTKTQYGLGMFTGAVTFSRMVAVSYQKWSWFAQLLTGLSFTGGCLITAALFMPLRGRKIWMAWLVGILAFPVAFYFFVPLTPDYALGLNTMFVWIEGGLFAAIGAGIIALAIVDLAQRRDAESLLLALWIIGTFSFATFFNWSITGRTILPMAPAAAILLMRRAGQADLMRSILSRYWRIFAAAIVSLLIAAADYQQANTAREAARQFQERFHAELGTKWFQSHWGFQYYMQQWGAKPLNAADSEITSGDVIMIPANNSLITPIPPDRVFTPEEINFPTLPLISTHGRSTGAAFYSSLRGPVPWVIDHVGPEMYYAARFR